MENHAEDAAQHQDTESAPHIVLAQRGLEELCVPLSLETQSCGTSFGVSD